MNYKDEILREIIKFHCPRFNELPNVPLYKEQVIMYVEDILSPLVANRDEKLLTPTMLNNYVKQKVVSPPKDKKYNKKHIAYLIVVCSLKQVFSLHEICILINNQIESVPIEKAYDYFCSELEKTLRITFLTRDFSDRKLSETSNVGGEVVKSTIMAFANKLFIQKYLVYMNREFEEAKEINNKILKNNKKTDMQ